MCGSAEPAKHPPCRRCAITDTLAHPRLVPPLRDYIMSSLCGVRDYAIPPSLARAPPSAENFTDGHAEPERDGIIARHRYRSFFPASSSDLSPSDRPSLLVAVGALARSTLARRRARAVLSSLQASPCTPSTLYTVHRNKNVFILIFFFFL